MEAKIYAVIKKDSNQVVNIILWDGITQWSPPLGTFVVQSESASIGNIYNPINRTFAQST